MNVNENFIIESFKAKTIDSICFYLYVKKHYKHSILYNFSYRSASLKLDISIPTIKHHIRVLLDLGLVQYRDNHMHFIALFKALILLGHYHKHRCTIKFDRSYRLKDIRALLLSKVIEMKTRQQDFCIKGKTALRLNAAPYKLIKRYARIIKDRNVIPENTITYKNIAQTLNITKTTAFNIVQRAKELKLLTSRVLIKNLGRLDKSAMEAILDVVPGHYYVRKGIMYAVLGTEYQSIRYPIQHNAFKDCSENITLYLSK